MQLYTKEVLSRTLNYPQYNGGRPEAYPTFYRLSDNSISGWKDNKKKAFKTFKSKKKEFIYYYQ